MTCRSRGLAGSLSVLLSFLGIVFPRGGVAQHFEAAPRVLSVELAGGANADLALFAWQEPRAAALRFARRHAISMSEEPVEKLVALMHRHGLIAAKETGADMTGVRNALGAVWHGGCNFTLSPGAGAPALCEVLVAAGVALPARAENSDTPDASARVAVSGTHPPETCTLHDGATVGGHEGVSLDAARTLVGLLKKPASVARSQMLLRVALEAVATADSSAMGGRWWTDAWAATLAEGWSLVSRALRRLSMFGAAQACAARSVFALRGTTALALVPTGRARPGLQSRRELEFVHAIQYATAIFGRSGDAVPEEIEAGRIGASDSAAHDASHRAGGRCTPQLRRAVRALGHELERIGYVAEATSADANDGESSLPAPASVVAPMSSQSTMLALLALNASAAVLSVCACTDGVCPHYSLRASDANAQRAVLAVPLARVLRNIGMISAGVGNVHGAETALRAQFAVDADGYRAWTNMWHTYDESLRTEARYFDKLLCARASADSGAATLDELGASSSQLCTLKALVHQLRADEKSPAVIARRFADSARLLRGDVSTGSDPHLPGATALTGIPSLLRNDHAYGSTTFVEWRELMLSNNALHQETIGGRNRHRMHVVLGSSLGWFVFYSALGLGVRARGYEVLPSAVRHARHIADAFGVPTDTASFECASAATLPHDALRGVTLVTVASKAWPRALRHSVYARLARFVDAGTIVLDYHDELASHTLNATDASKSVAITGPRFRKVGQATLRTGCGEAEGCGVYVFEALPLSPASVAETGVASCAAEVKTWRTLCDWVHANGGLVHHALQMRYTGPGPESRGVFVASNASIAQGELLFHVPRAVTMNVDSAFASPLSRALRSLQDPDDHTVVALHLAYERVQLLSGRNSFWKPYLDMLPVNATLPVDFHGVMEHLLGVSRSLQHGVRFAASAREASWELVRRIVQQHSDLFLRKPVDELKRIFLWAHNTVKMRSWNQMLPNFAGSANMIPVADTLNHHSVKGVHHYIYEGGAGLHARESLQAGAEVFQTYLQEGPDSNNLFCNSNLFNMFGFVIEDAAHDCFLLEIRADGGSPPASDARMDVLATALAHTSPTVALTGRSAESGVNKALVRIRLLLLRAQLEAGQVSVDLTAWQTLVEDTSRAMSLPTAAEAEAKQILYEALVQQLDQLLSARAQLSQTMNKVAANAEWAGFARSIEVIAMGEARVLRAVAKIVDDAR